MIKIPEEILSPEELSDATGRKVKDLDIEITGLSVDRSSLVLNIDTKLNFVMPRNLESIMKERIRAKLGSVHTIRVNYMYTGIKVSAPPADAGNDNASQYNGGGGNGVAPIRIELNRIVNRRHNALTAVLHTIYLLLLGYSGTYQCQAWICWRSSRFALLIAVPDRPNPVVACTFLGRILNGRVPDQ
jgi:hypothetical protein